MTTGETLYLLMVLVMFGAFGLTLAYFSHAQAVHDRATPKRAAADPSGPLATGGA